jgi:hypothetical protein
LAVAMLSSRAEMSKSLPAPGASERVLRADRPC